MDQTVILSWEDPPRKGKPSVVDYVATGAALIEKPNTWAKIHEASSGGVAHSIKRGLIREHDAEFEVVSRKLRDDLVGIWARYVKED